MNYNEPFLGTAMGRITVRSTGAGSLKFTVIKWCSKLGQMQTSGLPKIPICARVSPVHEFIKAHRNGLRVPLASLKPRDERASWDAPGSKFSHISKGEKMPTPPRTSESARRNDIWGNMLPRAHDFQGCRF